MAKVPRPGRVKTRLGSGVSPGQAAELYRAFLRDVLTVVDSARDAEPFERVLAVALEPADDPREAAALLEPGRSSGWTWFPQRSGDLGARIEGARRDGDAELVVVLGSDAPTMAPSRICQAFAALEAARRGAERAVVVGPTRDGGYDLIGFAGAVPEVLDGVPWSTPEVLSRTRARAAAAGVQLFELGEGYDIDEPEDLARAFEDASRPGSLAQETRAAIARLLETGAGGR